MLRASLRKPRYLLAGLLVAGTAMGSSSPLLMNLFTQDDVPMVLEDNRAQDPTQVKRIFTEGYWPAPYGRDLYRPLTSILLTFEWQLARGAPFAFRAVQLGLYAAGSIAVLILALQLLPFWGAVVAALFFAVHPVHVEAVALAVNQAEVVSALLVALAVAWYLVRRRAGVPTLAESIVMALVTLVAAHYKESGAMLPALLGATEICILTGSWRERLIRLRPFYLLQFLALELIVVIRSMIQPERLSGTFVAEVFVHATMWDRLCTMLVVVPEWLRLHLWPATLQVDYSPRVIERATEWGSAQWLGVIIVALIAWLAVRLRKRVPVFSFGVAWVAIALFPVSNVLIPTGIPMAERTMYLSSIGAMLAVVALGVEAIRSAKAERRRMVVGALVAIAVLCTTLGALRTFSRHQVWRTPRTLWGQSIIDTPDGYRSRRALGELLYQSGHHERAYANYRIAIELFDQSDGTFIKLAEWYRKDGDCESAIPLYRKANEIQVHTLVLGALTSCLAWVGDYAGARAVAMQGIGLGEAGGVFHAWLVRIKAAEEAGEPPHTVRFPAEYWKSFKNPAAVPGAQLEP